MFSALLEQFRRVGIRLTLWHTAIFLGATLVVLALTYLLLEARLVAQERNVIEFRLNQFVGEFEKAGVSAVRTLGDMRRGRQQNSFFLRMADQNNRTVYVRDAQDWAEFRPARLETEVLPAEDLRGWQELQSPHGTELVIAYARLPGDFLMQVGRSNEGIIEVLGGFRRATLLVVLVMLPVSIVGGVFFAARLLRPLQHVTAAAEKIITTGSFDARVPSADSVGELNALVQVFNRMLRRIERLIRAMRDSLDNVAHDLRTPMTRLRQRAQAALENQEDLETTREALADCVEEAERVLTLLNTLMDIAETEAGLVQLQRLPVNVRDVVSWAADGYAEVAEEKSIRIEKDVDAAISITGDVAALRRVLANLLDNAIKYTPAGGSIRISAEKARDFVALHVADTGRGILPEDLPRVWDRLFRGDRSRTERGLGLGLSFVKAIVEAHGGTAKLTSSPGRGTTVTTMLPVAPQTSTAPRSILHTQAVERQRSREDELDRGDREHRREQPFDREHREAATS